MPRWLTSLTETLGVPPWVAVVVVIAAVVLTVAGRLVRLYCLVHAVRVAVRDNGDSEHADRALKVIDKLTRRLRR
jgi:hypothetical protein